MPDVIRFGPNFVSQSGSHTEAIAAALEGASLRHFKTESARRQYVTRTLQAAGLTVASIAMVRARRYQRPLFTRSA